MLTQLKGVIETESHIHSTSMVNTIFTRATSPCAYNILSNESMDLKSDLTITVKETCRHGTRPHKKPTETPPP